MERLVYMSSKDDKYKLRPVRLTGYTDSISYSSFNNLIMSVTYKMSQKLKTLKIYDFVPSFSMKDEYDRDVERSKKFNIDPIFTLIGKEVTLMDYYKEIGYDYKKKKFDGLTLRQHIKKNLNKK